MSASVCASCLSRLRISTAPISRLPTFVVSVTAPFSTTSAQQNVVKKKSGMPAPRQIKHREARSARPRKKHKERPRPPAPGERKAQKQRIVLSNTNALEIQGLQYLSTDNMANASNVGEMLALNGPLLDQLRGSKTFKTTQNWSLFRQPSTLFRQETVELGQDIQEVTASQQDQGFGAATIQKIVSGGQGSGKSIHLLQAQSMAFLNDWIVITIPECKDHVFNLSSYAPVANDEAQQTPNEQQSQQLYDQPHLTSQILARMTSSNAKVLKTLKIVHQHPKSLPFKTAKTSTLFNLAEAGANDPTIAMQIFNALWKELTQPGASAPSPSDKGIQRPPILVTIDGINHWMGQTLYHSSDHKPIHAHQFTLIRHFLSLLFPAGQTNPLPSGGMILAATSGSNVPSTPSFDVLLQQLEALQSGNKMTDKDFPMPAPFSKTDQAVLDLIKNGQMTGVTPLKGLSKVESKGLLEYFARSGVLRERITEGFITEKWAISGGGVIGELARMSASIKV